jgi:glycerol-3-phosphate dehydrogenase
VHGNIIVGPDSKTVKRDFLECTPHGLSAVKKSALRLIPHINFKASIRNFAGLRADAGVEDFIVGESKTAPGFFNIAAIKSPGLTSACAIAKDVAKMINKSGIKFEPNKKFVAKRKVKRFKNMTEDEKRKIIAQNPAYATIVCRCQSVTEGEVWDALERPLPCVSIDGVKRRCTAGMGRCQGGFCGSRVQSLIAQKIKQDEMKVCQDKSGSYIVTGRTKTDK